MSYYKLANSDVVLTKIGESNDIIDTLKEKIPLLAKYVGIKGILIDENGEIFLVPVGTIDSKEL